MDLLDRRIEEANSWFASLCDYLLGTFEELEELWLDCGRSRGAPSAFVPHEWVRDDRDGGLGGRGATSTLKGRLFQEVCINVSTLAGTLKSDLRGNRSDRDVAIPVRVAGMSLIALPRSSRVPTAHLSVRYVAGRASWFAGSSALCVSSPTPTDAVGFKAALKYACDLHNSGYYGAFSRRYDALSRAGEGVDGHRGHGIAYEPLESGDWADDFAFTRDVGLAFLQSYPRLVRDQMLVSGGGDAALSRDEDQIRGRFESLQRPGWCRAASFEPPAASRSVEIGP